MALKGKKSSTVTMFRSTSRITTPSFISVEKGKTYYTPALTSRSQTIGDYIYSASATTFVGVKNNTTYYAAKSRATAYDIPAGTYAPSSFENLIKNYISQNGTRTLKNSCTISVVKLSNMSKITDSVTWASGSLVTYKCPYSNLRGVIFTQATGIRLHNGWGTTVCSFTTYCDKKIEWANEYDKYAIVTTGIKFN